jgi:drug/metabolite transporter (DMT)-like permease
MNARPGVVTPRVIAGLFALYLIWGSTYVPIQWAVKVYPPFFLAAARALAAGVVLYGAVRLRGAPRPRARDWGIAAVVGALLLVGGNALVSWSSQWVPSGIVALVIAMLPVWMVIFGRLHGTERRTPRPAWVGIVLGLAGVAILVGPKIAGVLNGDHGAGSWGVRELVGVGVVLLSGMCWANGSIISRRLPRPPDALLGVAMQLLSGGALAMLVALLRGEAGRLSWAAAAEHPVATWSLVYLTAMGTLVGYSIYIWLLHQATPALVSTYAYVNPVIAVILGCWLNGEALGPATILGAGVIVAGVAVIVTFGGQRAAPGPPEAGDGGPAAA